MLDIDFSFPFELNPEGIFDIETADGRNLLVLDFSSSPEGQELEIELIGDVWGTIDLPDLKFERRV